MTTVARVRRPRTDHRACAWTRALRHQLVLDLQWLVQPRGWTPLDDCHPPILAVGASGVRRLPSPDGMMLGVAPAATFGQATTSLDRGDFVVLYTDGVLHRSEPIDQGIDAVASLAAAARCCPPEVLDRVAYDAAGDDACVLVAERVR